MQRQCNFPTNVTPQLRELNGQGWAGLEEQVRKFIPEGDTLYVVTGACLKKLNETIEIKNITFDGKKIPIPNYYYKVLLKVHRENGEITGASTIGFWVKHEPMKKGQELNFACSVDDIEEYTGFNFFANLPKQFETEAESNKSVDVFRNF